MAKPMTWFTGLASISSTITSVSVDVPATSVSSSISKANNGLL